MTTAERTSAKPSWLWGPFSRIGLWVALLTLAADQAHKAWMLWGLRITSERVAAFPFLDLQLKINTGVSFSLFDSHNYSWQLALSAFAVAVSLGLWIWLARGPSNRIMGLGLGFIIGGAISNAIDRLWAGGVVDYLIPHAFGYSWPTVFNIADMAIVAGVGMLLYESLVTSRNDAANPL